VFVSVDTKKISCYTVDKVLHVHYQRRNKKLEEVRVTRSSSAVLGAMLFVFGCSGCEDDPDFDPCSVSGSEDNLSDSERAERCYGPAFAGEGAFSDPEYVTGRNWGAEVAAGHARDRALVRARPTFEDQYRGFLVADAERQRCVGKDRDVFASNDRCVQASTAALLVIEIVALVGEFPDHATALAPDVRRLREAHVAELEGEFCGVGFRLDVDYGAQEDRYVACPGQCHQLEGRAHDRCVAKCAELPSSERFRCVLDRGALEIYLEALTALGSRSGVPPAKFRLARLALARMFENPSPLHCEGESHSDYDRAYSLYESLGDVAAQQRVAKKRAYEIIGEDLCWDGTYVYDDDCEAHPGESDGHAHPAGCELSLIDAAEQWLQKANAKPDAQWRDQLVRWSEWAVEDGKAHADPSLACAAIALAERAQDADRVRKLRLAHGSTCATDGGTR
jgi:hypothetical protein